MDCLEMFSFNNQEKKLITFITYIKLIQKFERKIDNFDNSLLIICFYSLPTVSLFGTKYISSMPPFGHIIHNKIAITDLNWEPSVSFAFVMN